MLLRFFPENGISGSMTTGSPEHYTSLGPARDNLRQLVLLRTIAIAGQIITVAFVSGVLEIALPLLPLSLVIGFLALLNLATCLRLRLRQPVSDGELFAQILADVGAFTVILYF